MTRVLALLLVAAALAAAPNISGKWAGKTHMSVDGRIEEDTIFFTLKEKNGEVTGTAGPIREHQGPIRNGRFDGTRLTFELPVPNGVFQFDVNLEGDHLKGKLLAIAQGQTFKATVELSRGK